MYESPITLMKAKTDNFIKEVNEKTDEVIFKAVVNILPQVNKEELIKALEYDREQYSKGYKDRDSEIVRCKDCVYWKYRANRNGDEWGACLFIEELEDAERWTEDTDFCSYGERGE